MFKSSEAWYAIYVKVGKEKEIKEKITELSEDLSIKDIIAPEAFKKSGMNYVFSGYILIKAILDKENYSNLLQITDVYRFLGGARASGKSIWYEPDDIPENQISNLKRFIEGGTFFSLSKNNKNKFDIGEEVEIVAGDLASITGTVHSMSGNFVFISPNSGFSQLIRVSKEKVHKITSMVSI